LELASEKGCNEVKARGDSQLIVNQMKGGWQTNESHLRKLRDRVQELADEFKTFDIQHFSHDANWEGDELVEVGFSA
jgi:ribonuclease HI